MRSSFRSSALAAVLALAAVALAACSDSPSDSDSPLTVQISASTGPPAYTTVPGDTTVLMQCEMVLRATAAGKPNATAQWGEMKVRVFAGPDREAALDSFTISSAEVQQSWGSPSIATGATQEGHWDLFTAVPMSVTADVSYTVTGSSRARTAKYEASCPASTGATAPPTVSNVQVTPALGEVQPGQTLAVTYDLTAPAGLWETSVVLSGAVSGEYRTREQFQTSGQRTRTISIPGGGKLGQAVTVQVRVTDMLLRTVSATHPGPLTVVDRTPPTLLRVATRAAFNPRENDMVGQYAPGDTIEAMHIAADNDGLTWVGWGVEAPGVSVRDSLPVSNPNASPLRIPVRPEWVGGARLSVWVTDRSGMRSNVMSSLPDSIRVYPVRNRPVRTAHTPGDHFDAALDPARGLLYLAMPDRREIAVLSLATMTFGAPISVPGLPWALDLTVSGDSLVVALPHSNALAVVNLRAAGTPAQVVSTGAFAAGAVRIAADGRVLVAAPGTLAAVDLGTGTVTTLATESAVPYGGLSRTPDRTKVVYGGDCRFEYDAASRTVSPCRALEGVGRFAMDDAGRVFSRGPWLYRAGATQPHLFPMELALTNSSAPSPDGTEVYLSSVRGLLRASVDGRILDRMPFPHVYGMFLFTDGGNTLLAVSSGAPGTQGTYVYAVDLR